ncbi:voltage-gated chloride channel family protein [Polynucleobacter sphagniphilus]|uniref:voltage-gated chloride channel family protein n=1 Tax=Polynucleobacter sphagniphilus TaxID=1743169 RepID=UPI00240678C4|nr:voltage-gated chloride channel family protein [Polynucleobacter sphagniphilus]MDF9787377.1 H+/Cl- antiporter ClcA [Polynucleobacter sphagniphilus]MDH6420695.1 H+/Cl- antiporter ClcA [Polynucleobacter sphagniphilus]MDH6523948.1 H+/Cl- antiporter ClcA [Polynucleobacter sphagniphilus]
MPKPPFFEQMKLIPYLGKWLVITTAIAILSGTASAFLLIALEWASDTRTANHWLIFLLPVAGFAVGWIYLRFGEHVERGNNLLIDEIHDPKKIIPFRMAPFVFFGNIISILFGASVGREGTAVQMGGALADQLTHLFQFNSEDRKIILMAGISAGFASVFGTPLAGAIFGLEVLIVGSMRYDAIFPCMTAAIIADQISLLWGVHHTQYSIQVIPAITSWGLFAMVIAGVAFGLTGKAFAETTHHLTAYFKKIVAYAPLRPFIGGIAIIAATYLMGSDRYIGLGIPTIYEAFNQPVAPYDFLGKMIFTITSLGSGFKGGEVTPLFYIGATLGNALAPLLDMPFSLLAGVGFVAVFAGAANTPLASMVMAMELFGGEVGIYAAITCVVSYLFSGHSSIYSAQRSHQEKTPQP